MQVEYHDIITPDVARGLADYIERVQKLVNNNDKFYACLPSVILDFGYDRPAHELAAEIINHG